MPIEEEDRDETADEEAACPKSDDRGENLGQGAIRCLQCKKSQNQLVRCGKSW